MAREPWYPGAPPGWDESPWVADRLRPFDDSDADDFWFIDFHWPRGLTPLALATAQDSASYSAQLAAELLPLPPTRGLRLRVAGTHVYMGTIAVESPWELAARGRRLSSSLPRFLDRFGEIWAGHVADLSADLAHFEGLELDGLGLDQLALELVDARQFHRRAWHIHFEVMYPLAAAYLEFYGLCSSLDIDPARISLFLQGEDTKIMEADRGLWDLAERARRAELDQLFVGNDAEAILPQLRAAAGAGPWLSALDAYLAGFGHRTEGICDPGLSSWIEDPTPALGMIKTFLLLGRDHDFEHRRKETCDQRDAALDDTRSSLAGDRLADFERALDTCRRANFAWWNEEHNHYIDLRSALPLRRAALAVGRAVGSDAEDDMLFLFWNELLDVARGLRPYTSVRSLVGERRAYFDEWRDRRAEMPKVMGTVPASVDDPILIEIFGLHHHFFESLDDDETEVLVGMGTSPGVVRGRARVLHDAGLLHEVAPGDVLVCEATSPNWTPAFAKLSACVCDGGGSLTHASIVSREYGIPCVVGTARATQVLSDGDLVEVDGSNGVVRRIGRG